MFCLILTLVGISDIPIVGLQLIYGHESGLASKNQSNSLPINTPSLQAFEVIDVFLLG